jgi:hypothetical protein
LFFAKYEQGDSEGVFESLFGRSLSVEPEHLFQAIDELEKLARWLDPQLEDLRWRRKKPRL